MKHPLLNCLTILLLFISCKENKAIDVPGKISEKSIEEIAEPEQYIEDDVLLSRFQSDLERLSKNPKFVLEKELVENRHVDNLVDTIKILKFRETSIQSYRAVSEEWICDAKIINAELPFSESVKITMSKKELEKILRTKLSSDIVKVGNLEQTSVFIFNFKNDLLQEIIYEGYVD